MIQNRMFTMRCTATVSDARRSITMRKIQGGRGGKDRPESRGSAIGVSERHFRRCLRRFRMDGPAGITPISRPGPHNRP